MRTTMMKRDATAGDMVAVYLQRQWTRIEQGAADRQGEGATVHRTRVAIRRARTVLRSFPELFDAPRAARMDTELAWYAGLLGAVRDPQVQRARLATRCAGLADDVLLGPVAARIDEHLLGEELRARAARDEALDSARFRTLQGEITGWGDDVPFTDAAGRSPQTLVPAVRRRTRKPARRLVELPEAAGDARDAALHRARKAAKRARYAAELARPVLGKKATRWIRRHCRLQDLLGEQRDAVLAAALVRRLGAAVGTRPGENGFSYGLLYQQEVDAAAAAVQDVLGR